MEQKRLNDLQANWIWVPGWIDSCEGDNTAGRVVAFTREFNLEQPPDEALIHCSADTRYKLIVNGKRVAVGPSRSSSLIWYYDTLDIRPWFKTGSNVIEFLVLRYFSTARAAFPFERTIYPGLTVVGNVRAGEAMVDLCSAEGWQAQVYNHIQFPMGLPDDVFLHIYERVVAPATTPAVAAKAYQVRTLNGDLSTWRLRRREIPMYEETPLAFTHVRGCQSVLAAEDWQRHISDGQTLTLDGGSTHVVELQAECHSTAFLRFRFRAVGAPSSIKAKITYSEGYELEPRSYPFFRSKGDRLDAEVGHLIGPFDETRLDLEDGQTVDYEPFWFRTFRIIRVELQVGSGSVEMSPPKATQVNYPMAVKASWKEPGNPTHEQMLEVSIRTMRNCMFDGYSDCPFYEQLQYAGDSRTVALFHYLLSGDDRLMRQAIQNFAASATPEGLTQSRFPSHVHQIIAGFSLYWVLQVCDHHLFFGDTKFSRSFLPRIDGVLEFFDAHVDSLGLVSGMPEDVWHFVDWVTTWGATDEHPDKGVPTSGRKSNRHTYFSMLYAYVLKAAARLVRDVGRPGHAEEYEARAKAVVQAIRTHCYDGQFFTDSTADVAGDDALSQHCQVFAVLCGAAEEGDRERILSAAFSPGSSAAFSKCSYMMTFYALRAHALAGDAAYERLWTSVWDPWRRMLGNNLSTWEEDDVRQRSDCHAWGSVPVFEFLAEVAGVHPTAPGASEISFRPRVRLSAELEAKVALGRSNVATVSWRTGADGVKRIEMTLLSAVVVVSQLPGREERHHGLTDRVSLEYSG